MHPYFEISGKSIPAYSICGIIGWLLGLAYILLQVGGNRKKADDALYIYVYGSLGMLTGAKLLFLLLSADQIIHDILNCKGTLTDVIFKYLSGGFVYYGGMFGCILGCRYAARCFRLRAEEYYYLIIPAMLLVAAAGRVGCFLTGCCFGVEWNGALSVVYPEGCAAPAGVPLFPVQPAETVFDLVLFGIMCMRIHAGITGKKLLRLYLLSYAAYRFIAEFLRGDTVRGIIFGFSVSQYISLAIISFCLITSVIPERFR